MFDAISRWFRKRIITDEFIMKIIDKTLDEYLRQNYEICIVDELPQEIIDVQQNAQNMSGLDSQNVTAITSAFIDDVTDFDGIIFFSLSTIQRGLTEYGIFDGMEFVQAIVIHECRHADQFEFLRSRGGSELIRRVMEDQKQVPYDLSIVEMDAYYYQFTGESMDFESVFAEYLCQSEHHVGEEDDDRQ